MEGEGRQKARGYVVGWLVGRLGRVGILFYLFTLLEEKRG